MIFTVETGTCERCLKPLEIGEHAFCPHGRGSLRVIPDSIPGGLVIENFAPQPIRFDSHSEKRRYMEVHGIHEAVRHVGVPGSDKSPYTTRHI